MLRIEGGKRMGWFVVALAFCGCTAALDFDALKSGLKSSDVIDTEVESDTGEPGVPCEVDADCNDDIDCTEDKCGSDGLCTQSPSNALCSGYLVCRVGKGCVDVGRECLSDAECDDEIECTRNICTTDGKCKLLFLDDDVCNEENRCLIGATCDATLGCTGGFEKACDQVDGPHCYNYFCKPSTGKCEDTEFRPGADKDGDGYCSADSEFGGDDCDDGDEAVHPGADEKADNQADDDCDGETDETDLG